MTHSLLALAVAPLLTLAATCAPPTPTSPPALPPCPGSIVEVMPGQQLTCDVTPPQIMIEVGSTAIDCDNSGGTFFESAWDGRPDLCIDLDY